MPRNMAGAEKYKKSQEREENKEKAELEAKKAYHAKQEALTREIIDANKDISRTLEKTATDYTQSLAEIKSQIDKIKLEIPEQDNGDIVSAINNFSKTTSELISNLSENVSKIKLETKEIDLSQHTDALTDSIDQNIASLEKVITELTKSVSQFQIEIPEPRVEWVFDVTRNKDGYIEQIHAVAPYEEA